MWYREFKRRWMEFIRWGFKSPFIRVLNLSEQTLNCPNLSSFPSLLPSSNHYFPSLKQTDPQHLPFNGFGQKLQLKISVETRGTEKTETSDSQASFSKIPDSYSDFKLTATHSIPMLRQPACCTQVMDTALERKMELTLARWSTRLTWQFHTWVLKLVIAKFNKHLESGIMNQSAPEQHIRWGPINT